MANTALAEKQKVKLSEALKAGLVGRFDLKEYDVDVPVSHNNYGGNHTQCKHCGLVHNGFVCPECGLMGI